MSDNLFCKITQSSIHQCGLFATRDIERGTKIIQIFGEKISKEETLRRALESEAEGDASISEILSYFFRLDDNWNLDGRAGDNLVHYMNHSCDENCKWDNRSEEIWVVACRDIERGEELTCDYGCGIESFQSRPCHCGAKSCIGYIVGKDQREKVEELLKPPYKIAQSSIHQCGLFATRDIEVGTEIIQYIGEKISKEESRRRILEWHAKTHETGEGMIYNFGLDEDWTLDGRVGDNPARYINHSCDPNCESINCSGEIWIVARRDIKKGEELSFNYGCDIKSFRRRPCSCGTENCIGYIVHEDHHEKVKELLKPSYKVAQSSIHQHGLFAIRDIEKGTEIIEYVGEKISKEEADRRSSEWEKKVRETGEGMVYIFELDDDLYLDGRVADNVAGYMNHSCDANCHSFGYLKEIWIVASRDIKRGEELTYDYGYDIETFRNNPCNCGARNCVGYIVHKDQRERMKELLKT